MRPKVSIIIPHRNQTHLLPRLFDSIVRQSVRPLEVILLDADSDEPCGGIAREYAAAGLHVRLISCAGHTPVWRNRIRGAALAASETLAFADADDILWGEDVLERHAALLKETRADILHFRSVLIDDDLRFTGFCAHHDPLHPELFGEDIFRRYAEKGFAGDPLWTKVTTRALWTKIGKAAEGSLVGNPHEDAYLNTLLMFHARHYIGSELCGYAHVPGLRIERHPQRIVDNYRIMAELVPYLRAHGCPEDLVARFIQRYKARICTYAGQFCQFLRETDAYDIPDEELDEKLHGIDRNLFFKALLIGNRMNASKITAAIKTLA